MESTTCIGIAPIETNPDHLLSQLTHKEWYLPGLEKKGDHRKCEWLTVRLLLKEMLGEEKEIRYHDSGKPYLADGSYHLGISHTKGLVAVILDRNLQVSIDIEYVSPRVENIRQRFMSRAEEENISLRNERIHLLLHWSAKESLYKFLEDTRIDFQKHLHILPFDPQMNEWASFRSKINFPAKEYEPEIRYFATEKYVLTCISDANCFLSKQHRALLFS